MKQDNRGLSLVELIIAIAILLIVAGMVGGFMVSGARAYTSVSTRVSLQTKAQMLLNQIREYAIDCSYAIYYNDNTLTIIDAEEGGSGTTYTTHTFQWDGADTVFYTMSGDSTQYKVSTEVTDFKVSFQPSALTLADKVTSMTVEMTLTRNGKDHPETLKIALRNRPKFQPTPSLE